MSKHDLIKFGYDVEHELRIRLEEENKNLRNCVSTLIELGAFLNCTVLCGEKLSSEEEEVIKQKLVDARKLLVEE